LDYNSPSEELVQVNSVAGLSLTIARAVDGTSATSHNAGAVVRHVSSARDFADSRTHENSSAAVHGLAVGSNLVGTNDTQTLTNKTLTSPSITGTVTGGGTYSSPILATPTITGAASFTGTQTTTGLGTFGEIKVTNPSAFNDNSAAVTWTTEGGLHTPSFGNAVKLYKWKIVDGIMQVYFSVVFGSTTNFGAGATNGDNWFIGLPAGYTALADWQATNIICGTGRGAQGGGKAFMFTVKANSVGTAFSFDVASGFPDGTVPVNTGAMDSLTPFTWASGNIFQFSASVPVSPSF
jgi:hypothetical protein